MTSTEHAGFARNWKDIASAFLRLGATSYGGPAILGIMQAELQEKRQWVSRERFVEGLSLVVMLALTIAYASLGVTPILRGALYGLGPVVLGVFVVAVCRLGRSAVSTVSQVVIAVAAAPAAIGRPLGIAVILVLSGGAGLLLFHSRRPGVIVVVASAAVLAVLPVVLWSPSAPVSAIPRGVADPASLADIGAYFFKVGAFTVGGGLTMIAFIQQQVVGQFHWLTPREFIDGLALGQFTPGPILMVAAYVGYKVAGVA